MSAPATTTPRETVDALFRALDALDVDTIEAMFSSDPQGIDELSGGWRRGREAMRQYLAMLRESGIADVRSSVSDVHLTEWGDTALATLMLDQTYTMGGQAQSIHAPTTLVLRREEGAWRVALVHTVPVDQPT